MRITHVSEGTGVHKLEVSAGESRDLLEETQPSQPLQNDVISLDGGQYNPYAIQLQINTSDRVGHYALSELLLRVDKCCQIRAESIHDKLGLKCGKGNLAQFWQPFHKSHLYLRASAKRSCRGHYLSVHLKSLSPLIFLCSDF